MSKQKKKQEQTIINESNNNTEKIKITRITKGDTIEEVIEIERPIKSGKEEEKGTEATFKSLKFITETLLEILCWACIIVGITLFSLGIEKINEQEKSIQNIVFIVLSIIYSVVLVLLSIPFYKIKKDIKQSDNKQFILNIFLAVIALVALIVSTVSIFIP